MKPIVPFLWFDTQAEEAAKFYVSVFPNSKITNVSRYGKGGPMPEGTVLTVAFELNGTEFVALNGGPEFRFNPAVSFAVNCADQGEIDYYWERLSEGGQPNVCGWLTDRYGLSWQIVPENIGKLVASQAGFDAMMKMTKIDIGELERASKGASV